MAALNLHIHRNYIENKKTHVLIKLADRENMGLDTYFVMLSHLFTEILAKIYFRVMAALNLHILKNAQLC